MSCIEAVLTDSRCSYIVLVLRRDNMIGYVTLGTSDLARGAKFYDAIAAEMDTGRMMEP